MATDVDAKIIKSTHDVLSKIIKKPALSDKLLKRPPFRFLHDVITNIIQTNGVMETLYTDDEMVFDNIKDKDSKINFLQKVIDVTGFVINDVIVAKPAKIVAGLEADKTNQWLQILAQSVIAKKGFTDAVERVLNGEKPVKQKAAPPINSNKKAEVNGNAKPVNKTNAKVQSKTKGTPKERRDETKPQLKPQLKQDTALSLKSNEKPKTLMNNTEVAKSNDDISKPSLANENIIINNDTENNNNTENEIEPPVEEKHETNNDVIVNGNANGNANAEETQNFQSETIQIHPRTAAKSPMRVTNIIESVHINVSEDNYNVPKPSLPRPTTARPMTARPSSARPAPPKVVTKREIEEEKIAAEMEEKMRLQSVKPVENLIIENATAEDNDDDEFVISDATKQTEDDLINNGQLTINDVGDSQKGSLVKQLMDTKKELEGNQQQETPMGEKGITKLAARDIEKLRQSIQLLSKCVNPLGRDLDYLQEDIDAMMAELKSWRDEYKGNMTIVEKERTTIDGDLEPLKTQLNLLDRDIEDQLEKISITKANIIRNDERIQKMMLMINRVS